MLIKAADTCRQGLGTGDTACGAVVQLAADQVQGVAAGQAATQVAQGAQAGELQALDAGELASVVVQAAGLEQNGAIALERASGVEQLPAQIKLQLAFGVEIATLAVVQLRSLDLYTRLPGQLAVELIVELAEGQIDVAIGEQFAIMAVIQRRPRQLQVTLAGDVAALVVEVVDPQAHPLGSAQRTTLTVIHSVGIERQGAAGADTAAAVIQDTQRIQVGAGLADDPSLELVVETGAVEGQQSIR